MNIIEIELLTDNLDKTESFYADLLGLQRTKKDENSISFKAGQSTLTFIKSTALKPSYHFAFNIPHNQLDEAIIWASAKLDLIKNTETGIIANFQSWNAKAIYFFDNNGNILEFIARFDLNNHSDKPFGSSSIHSISEIGIVADTPLKLADNFIEAYQLSYFERDSKSKNFVALGNDNGLLIIVAASRNWYPTEQAAEKYYTRIKISVDGIIREITLNN